MIFRWLTPYHQVPTITGPSHRVNAGAKGKFVCSSRGFPSKNITVKWTKNRQPVQALRPNIFQKSPNSSYEIHSTASVQLTEQDINSKLTCKIQHPSFSKPLEQSFDLNNVLRVAPKVTLTTSHPSPIPLNQSVKLTCKADNFYPGDISVSWWRSDYSNYTAKDNNSRGYGNGTYHLSLPLSTRKTGKMETTYMCQVIHDSEKIYYVSKTLKFGMLLEGSTGKHSVPSHKLVVRTRRVRSPALEAGALRL
uniref:Uncharacterized protein n=1 Tax=Sphaerodactylus townsendi TaxID=933632 RepID=A0ACB8F759_9SAUR